MDQALQEELIHILRDMRDFMHNQNRRLEKLESSAQAHAEDNGSTSHETDEHEHDKRLGNIEKQAEVVSPLSPTQPSQELGLQLNKQEGDSSGAEQHPFDSESSSSPKFKLEVSSAAKGLFFMWNNASVNTQSDGMSQEKEAEFIWPAREYYDLHGSIPHYRLGPLFYPGSPRPFTKDPDPHHLVCDDGWKYCECSRSHPAQLRFIISFT
jgi:hypothetical protein